MELKRKEAIDALDRIHNYCEGIDNHIPEEERTGYKMYPDVHKIFDFLYMNVFEELNSENKLLNVELGNANSEILRLIEERKQLTEENERLMDECGNQSTLWRQHFESIYETAKDTLKADTVRKMQKEIEARCVKGGIYPAFVKSTINQIAEEMMGGNDADKED